MVAQRSRLFEAEVTQAGARIVVCEPLLDAARAQTLADYLLDLAGRVPGGRLEVDLGNVSDICPCYLGTLMGVGRMLQAGGGQLTLLGATGEVFEAA
jgi:anti-anti-sigma regulatory factor